MKSFKKVVIIGVGLIGGSLALAIKKKKIAYKIVGVSRHKSTLLLAKKRGVIDEGSQDIRIADGADLVILATPIETMLKLAVPLSKIIDKDCLVADVGSTKEEVVKKMEKVFANFIGTHPLAGSEKRGVANARADIFSGSLCVLTPTARTCPQAKKRIKALWQLLGARVTSLSPRAHDKIIAFVSHLPHIVSFSLIGSVPKNFLGFSASGLKDTTRIASSDSSIWTSILLSNHFCLPAIEAFQKHLSEIKKAVKNKDKAALDHILRRAKDKRGILE
ncbi:MAG: prephenate dehydrogenase [Candidatus Omnitrophica bacterium]|nr:prephenate dehydrogenase [Candidatus Omnitrophota bacterium]MDD5512453.1 prephenate dehydrogenase [Candidatus Omnitrophota bacterium]